MTISKLKKGVLVAVEGIDGSGKTTLVRALEKHLKVQRIPVIVSKEPTDSPWGKSIQSLRYVGEEFTLRVHPEGENAIASRQVTPREELELFINDRKEHVEKVIKPALKQNKLVILDRYYFSSVAYQGALKGLDPKEIKKMNEEFAPRPDLVLLLTISPRSGLSRITKNRKKGLDSFERGEYLAKVQKVFDELDEPYIRRIDASRPEETVLKEAIQAVEELLA